jgi:RsiW-degrading membrane proteinase PrsW (M82 family)
MDLWHQMLNEASAWFSYPNVSALQLLVAVGLAVAFGAVWLAAHWPPLFKRPWFWAVAVFSAFFTMAAFAFVHTPLQFYYDKLVNHFLNSATISDWLLLLGIPSVLIVGLVEEGAKMVPMLLYWWKDGRRITPAMGLAIGAVAGAAFGIFDAFQIFSSMFGGGWTTAAFSHGFTGIAGFWERFFTIGFHTAVSAMVGYGLARGKGWQYFLVAAGFHALFNYSAYFYAKQYFGLVQVETMLAVIAVIVTAVVLIVRYRLRRDFPGEAAYDPVLYLEYEERYAAEEAAAGAEAATTAATVESGIEDTVSPRDRPAPPAAPEEPPSETATGEKKD